MKLRIIIGLLSVSLLLTGCSWLDGQFVSVTPHREQRQSMQNDVIAASNYLELLDALKAIIASGTEVAAINVAEYPQDVLVHGLERAVQYAMTNDPIGSYAVEGILYELGTSSGLPALSIKEQDGFTSIFCGAKYLSSELLRAAADYAGCHLYCDSDDVLYANRNYVVFHSSSAGKKTLRFPGPVSPYEVYEERLYGQQVLEISFETYLGETKMFDLGGKI